MKEFDSKWSPDGAQKVYEKILIRAIYKKLKILGVSYESIISEEYSPSLSDIFKNDISKLAIKENFEYFNEKNTKFYFGNAKIEIMNWEIFDENGNFFIPGINNENKKKVYRDIYNEENCNSLGILLKQGNKKAFFAGDMNNIPKKVGNEKIGDEDRLKDKIGKIDLLKLGHHGYQYSNTRGYMNVLKPEYAIITNDPDCIYLEINDYLEKNKVNYLYSTYDKYEVNAIITDDEIILGFGTEGIKKVKNKIFYIKEENIYKNYLDYEYSLKENIILKTAKNWIELKNIIENQNPIESINNDEKTIMLTSLKINLDVDENNESYIANFCIKINNYKKIILTVNEKEIIFKRDKSLLDYPLFYAENSCFILGEEKMEGKITIDGNKENMACNSNLIKLIESEYYQYSNVILCNNWNKTTKCTKKSSNINTNKFFGSAIYSINSKIHIYGGEICDNIHEISIDENNEESKLPEKYKNVIFYCSRGAGIYMINNSILNMYGGKISNNKGINNTRIYSNINSTILKDKNAKLEQNCKGVGIFATKNSQIFLYKGEISNNLAINSGKIFLKNPQNEKKNKIVLINSCICGSAIFSGNNTYFQMEKDFIIKNNYCQLNTEINIDKNNIVNDLENGIKGGQLFFSKSIVRIKGGLIENGKNISKQKKNIETNKIKKIVDFNEGGGIIFINCHKIEINNLKISKCNSDKGGAIFLMNSSPIISNSIFEGNSAKKFGGAIFNHQNSEIKLINNKITNNKAEICSGGGIYALGNLIIDGEDSLISDNIAGTFGGGIMVKKECQIKDGKISHNKALKNSGGGIRVDGSIEIIGGKICKNWANLNGGGLNYECAKKCIYNSSDIKIYKNKANNLGDDIFPIKD